MPVCPLFRLDTVKISKDKVRWSEWPGTTHALLGAGEWASEMGRGVIVTWVVLVAFQ